MERRKFLKSGCSLCLLGAAGLILPQTLLSCAGSGMAVYKTGIENSKITVPKTLFEKSPVQMVRPRGWFYDIAVSRKDEGGFSAILMKCTHMDNQLSLSSDGFHCSLHGSHFNKSGAVVKGPAEVSLTHYTVTVEENEIIIHI